MSSSALLSLPRELRDEIYLHLYPPSSNHLTLFLTGHSPRYSLTSFTLQHHTGDAQDSYRKALQHSTALLRTSKQLHHEATPFFRSSILYKIVVEGSSPGAIGSKLSEGQFRALVGRMRRGVVLVTWKYKPYGASSSSNPRLSDIEQVLSPLKRNTALLVAILRQNTDMKLEAIGWDFDARSSGDPVVVDSAVRVLEGLGRHEGVKLRNMALPREAVTEEALARLVRVLGGVDCSEPLVVESESSCDGPVILDDGHE
ncbi:hypothetical protein M409DRAFT_30945 [Zasmidium cellare ATCC 36951]|uniref:F-box domain-containing protein n=1 Tax=Zasmidium cellare ATCC 36951 TaxID=1080233 RepID=A0A6A6BV71_ZASCE|nr:uncharacterized protein M409DRAFT_30945 [Zasmidium cellare ATCC 36951]KAF2158575.1 hypothetical protein M409DRAFT_30945 [Zasmidium cellare ATCC 36951]